MGSQKGSQKETRTGKPKEKPKGSQKGSQKGSKRAVPGLACIYTGTFRMSSMSICAAVPTPPLLIKVMSCFEYSMRLDEKAPRLCHFISPPWYRATRASITPRQCLSLVFVRMGANKL